jgi:hypothetical protein
MQDILKRESERYYETHVKTHCALGELDHPNPTSDNFRWLTVDNISHRVSAITRRDVPRTVIISVTGHVSCLDDTRRSSYILVRSVVFAIDRPYLPIFLYSFPPHSEALIP